MARVDISSCCHALESERSERERKGDLDHYERFEGDRNQTSKFLAVKKVNTWNLHDSHNK